MFWRGWCRSFCFLVFNTQGSKRKIKQLSPLRSNSKPIQGNTFFTQLMGRMWNLAPWTALKTESPWHSKRHWTGSPPKSRRLKATPGIYLQRNRKPPTSVLEWTSHSKGLKRDFHACLSIYNSTPCTFSWSISAYHLPLICHRGAWFSSFFCI